VIVAVLDQIFPIPWVRLRVWAEAEKRVKKIRPTVRGNRILLFYPQSGENPRVFFHLEPGRDSL
jgi:hypothetical protein